MSRRKKSAFAVAFPVSSVWFGAIVGPSMVSGVYESIYFAPYGALGILLPIIAMGLAAIVIGMGANFARHYKVYNYNSFSKKLYGKFSKFLVPVLEVYMIIAMMVGGSAVIAMSSSFLNEFIGLPYIMGALFMALVCTVLVLWGAKIVRAFSAVISIALIVGLLVLAVMIISTRPQELGKIISTGYVPENISIATGISGAVALGLSNCCNALTLSAVEQEVSKTSHCAAIGIISTIMNSAAFIVTTCMLLPYCPDVLSESIPILSILKMHLLESAPWLHHVYSIVMIMALISSGVPQLHAVASRIRGLYPANIKSDTARNAISGVIYFAACIFISYAGLTNIVSIGYRILGYLAIPLLAVPICIIWPIIWHRNKQNEKEDLNYADKNQLLYNND